ncbi:hypothetical protein HNP37_002515 [Flavobacterium nitrogenifigens]|uniref:DUF3592 domain-containing protein n=2 Tax=Flavobacterium TaxID=237 RepID=A0A7W7N8I9_9FLAO|nr:MULTISPECIES: DUF3592 domain-containing protein [Flavobacterium]MBB4802442.1 hypothetical protein [Flavobacterium nitrogenifigens]MBB6387400.1 hypothetical protein [Flavobacterium notoginsengisoli]
MKAFSIFNYVFSLIGAGLLAGAIYLYVDKQAFLEKAETTQGTVIEMIPKRSKDSTTYSPVVSFITKSGQTITYTSSVSSNPPSYDVGENVEIFYDPANPNDAEINGFVSLWLGVLILGGIGIVFFLIGSLGVLLRYLKNKKAQNLRETGKPIAAKFTQVQLNTNQTVNGRNPFLILSQWQDPKTDELYVFKSDSIWFDPTDFVKTDTIRVFIDPENPKDYVMDISFLPKLKN